MKKILYTITCEGETEEDLNLAFEEAGRLIKEGYTSGHDSNNTGSYSFDLTELES